LLEIIRQASVWQQKCNVKKRAVERGLEAVEKGRLVGLFERPRHLKPQEEATLVSLVEEADDQQQAMTYRRFQEVVCSPPSLF
jgi:hypothetical protein